MKLYADSAGLKETQKSALQNQQMKETEMRPNSLVERKKVWKSDRTVKAG